MFKVDIVKSKTLEEFNEYLKNLQVEGVIILDVKPLQYCKNDLKNDYLISLGARK